MDLDGGVVAYPLVLAILAVAAVEETAADAVTMETTAATDGDAVVFFPFFFLFVVVRKEISEVHLTSGSSTIR